MANWKISSPRRLLRLLQLPRPRRLLRLLQLPAPGSGGASGVIGCGRGCFSCLAASRKRPPYMSSKAPATSIYIYVYIDIPIYASISLTAEACHAVVHHKDGTAAQQRTAEHDNAQFRSLSWLTCADGGLATLSGVARDGISPRPRAYPHRSAAGFSRAWISRSGWAPDTRDREHWKPAGRLRSRSSELRLTRAFCRARA